MAPTVDPLATFLGTEVALALRRWAKAGGGIVELPDHKWSASGFTGAVVTAILFTDRHPDGSWRSRKQIIKVIPAGKEWETGLHELAWEQNTEFAKRYLVRQLGRPCEVGDGRHIMFQDIAGDLLDYRPIDKLSPEIQEAGCAAVARLVLSEWNGDRWPDRVMLDRDAVDNYLRHELREPIERIERWADERGLVRPGDEHVGVDRLPNPVAMVRSGLSARHVVIQYMYGLSHGDLHRGNILVPDALPLETDQIRVVDLAAFDPAASLTRDLVALCLSAAAAELSVTPEASASEYLVRLLLAGTGEPSGPEKTGKILRAVLRAAGQPAPFRVEWRAQYLLSLLAGALAHTTYRNHSDAVQRWFFHVATRAGAEFLRFAEERDMIPAEPETDEKPEQVSVSLVSAGADRPAAYDLQHRLADVAKAGALNWTIHVRRHREEAGESPRSGLSRPDVVVVLLSERSAIDPGCKREIRAALTGAIDLIGVRTDQIEVPHEDLRGAPVLDCGDEGFADLVGRITEISMQGRVGRMLEEKLSRTEAEEQRADGAQRRRLAIHNREQRVRLEDELRRRSAAGRRRDAAGPADLTEETVSDGRVRLVNQAPFVPAAQFHDRVSEKHRVEEAIADPSTSVVVVHGAAGVGKTAFAAELRRRLAAREAEAEADAVVYLSADGYRPINVAAVLADLARALPESSGRARLEERLNDPVEWREKLTEVLAALRNTTVVVILDAAEHLLDDGTFRDRELGALVMELAGRPGHPTTLVLTVAGGPPQQLRRDLPANVRFVPMNPLPFDDAIALLIALDRGAALALYRMEPGDRQRAYLLSQGNPRTLELLVGVLRQEPGTPVPRLLDELERVPLPDVEATLLKATFSNLDRTQQRVVQALAVYGRPVLPEAVDFLLAALVPGVDSAPILRGLHERRVAHHDHGHYFLPPAESDRVVRGLERGDLDDHRRVPLPFTRFAMWHHAARYFEERRVAPVRSLLDLRPAFSEIDLRIRAWDCRHAYEVMNTIEDYHLRRWGQSNALLEWRHAVRGRIGDDTEEANNRRRIVAALQQQERIEDAIVELAEARRKCSWFGAPKARLMLDIQLATVRFEAGEFSHAARLFRRQVWQCRILGRRRELVIVRADLALCLARTGHHAQALRAFSTALANARALLDTVERERILPLLLIDYAWALGQIGEPRSALALLQEGVAVASGAATEDEVALGLCFNGEAAVHIDSDAAGEAVEPARRAAELGVRTRDPRLIRQANLNLGLAYLRIGGRDDEALAAAEVSARLDSGGHAVGANGLLGIAAFRQRMRDRARLAFLTSRDGASERIAREPRDYLAWEAKGLASFGLALIEESQRRRRLAEAGEAFEQARQITAARGAVNRSTALLGAFGQRADDELVAAMTAVARGSASPFSY
ncbi:AAA family ATPase [Micromonospora profundi]